MHGSEQDHLRARRDAAKPQAAPSADRGERSWDLRYRYARYSTSAAHSDGERLGHHQPVVDPQVRVDRGERSGDETDAVTADLAAEEADHARR